jgi:hypothetical protein
MSDLRERIAAVQRAHMGDPYDQDMGECPCGFKYVTCDELAAHIADAVIVEIARFYEDSLQSSVLSDLRERIARVLHSRFGKDLGYADAEWDEIDQTAYIADADALIRELPELKYAYVPQRILLGPKTLCDPDMIAADQEWRTNHPEKAQ